DWMMRYVPGPKAKNEFEYFTGKTGILETKIEISRLESNRTAEPMAPAEAQQSLALESSPESTSGSPLLDELFKRGINPKQAAELLQEILPDQPAVDQLEYADYRIASEAPGTFRNPPGFYISVLRDNTPVPANFESTSKRKQRQFNQDQLDGQRQATERRALELEVQYAEYRRTEVEAYIERELTPAAYAAMVDEQKRNYVAQFRNAAHWPAETLHAIAVNAAAVEIARRAPITAFDEFCRKHNN
ncbi:MAG: hypothetical protein ABI822_28355, partial [Bryobacteraceae bacterium]